MTDIPDNVLEQARKIADQVQAEWNTFHQPTAKEVQLVARALMIERERIAKRVEETYRTEEGEALRATFIEPDTKDGYLQAWHQASDVADFIRYVA